VFTRSAMLLSSEVYPLIRRFLGFGRGLFSRPVFAFPPSLGRKIAPQKTNVNIFLEVFGVESGYSSG